MLFSYVKICDYLKSWERLEQFETVFQTLGMFVRAAFRSKLFAAAEVASLRLHVPDITKREIFLRRCAASGRSESRISQ
jgi:hypothetical protein